MTHTVSHFEDVITRFRHMLPAKAAKAQAIDRHTPWKRIAMRAIDAGHFESADEFVRFVEACLRHLALEQAVSDRANATGVRNLADAIARLWTCPNSTKNAPSADEIADLLQSEWVTSGNFRSLRSEFNHPRAEKNGR